MSSRACFCFTWRFNIFRNTVYINNQTNSNLYYFNSIVILQIVQRNDKLLANNNFEQLFQIVELLCQAFFFIYMQFDQSNPRLSFTRVILSLLKLHIITTYVTLYHIR